jgi:hypothetical protein
MIRPVLVLALLAAPAILVAQPVQVTQAERQRLAALGLALGQCHRMIVQRDARTRFSPAEIADRALAACVQREVPIRAELLRQIGPQRTAAAMQAQRAHWRQAIGQMVAQARRGH